METLMAWLVGFLFAAGVFALLRRNLVRLVIGVILLSHAANLLIFSAGGLTRAAAQWALASIHCSWPPPAWN